MGKVSRREAPNGPSIPEVSPKLRLGNAVAHRPWVALNREENWDEEDGKEKKEKNGLPSAKPRVKRELLFVESVPEVRRSKRIKASLKQGEVKEETKGGIRKREVTSGGDVKSASPAPAQVKVKQEPEPEPEPSTGEAPRKEPTKKQPKKPKPAAAKTDLQLQTRKLAAYTQYAATKTTPFPRFPRPTPAQCRKAHEILTRQHGEQKPKRGCGRAPSVLGALVDTILSQNTTARNSAAARRALDAAYGAENWAAVAEGGVGRLARTIAGGGLAGVKSAAIHAILTETRARRGGYTLEHLRGLPDDAAMRELLSFRGVGPKTASCVLLFCLSRPSFAVDTHVYRISGVLGWRPAGASREETHAHLEARVPDSLKFALHLLLVLHGRACGECRAGGTSLGRCELRRVLGGGRWDGEVDEMGVEEMGVHAEEVDEKKVGEKKVDVKEVNAVSSPEEVK
ncbi:base excision DNA repair protein [Xylaria intraflava]|nr:base excision DNA repair protein [Xylaria intraflava]